ncbi:hypothetical protein ACLQ2R_38430 [Streptosporangium sp. DT93]|uniref:hypothetical protein n=1 Tax=Streptosporangium sp. DT93 TaxID=3393428 RepID=UPI003CF77FE1
MRPLLAVLTATAVAVLSPAGTPLTASAATSSAPLTAVPAAPAGAAAVVPAPASPTDCSGTGTSDFDGDGVDDAAAGDPFTDPGGAAGAGAVHVLFSRGERGKVVTAPTPGAGDGFGWSVRLAEINADGCADLLVGAPYTDVGGRKDAGAVYVIYGGPAGRTVRLVAPEPEADAHFGWSVTSGASLVAVGAPHEDADGVTDSGAAYVFDVSAPGPGRRVSQETGGVPGNGEDGDMFGWSLAIGRLGGEAGDLDLAVGAPYENDDGAGRQSGGGKRDSGSIAVVFDVNRERDTYRSRKWDLREVADTDEDDRFGYAMSYAQQGDVGYLAVSAPLGDGGGVPDTGLVQLFQASSSLELTTAATLHQDTGNATGDGYGMSLALNAEGGVRLAVGVPFDGKDQKGGVHLVTVGDGTPGRMIAQGGAGDHFGRSVGFSGNRLVVGAPDRAGSGAVVLLGRNDAEGLVLAPGTGRIPDVDGAAPVEFGSTVG